MRTEEHLFWDKNSEIHLYRFIIIKEPKHSRVARIWLGIQVPNYVASISLQEDFRFSRPKHFMEAEEFEFDPPEIEKNIFII